MPISEITFILILSICSKIGQRVSHIRMKIMGNVAILTKMMLAKIYRNTHLLSWSKLQHIALGKNNCLWIPATMATMKTIANAWIKEKTKIKKRHESDAHVLSMICDVGNVVCAAPHIHNPLCFGYSLAFSICSLRQTSAEHELNAFGLLFGSSDYSEYIYYCLLHTAFRKYFSEICRFFFMFYRELRVLDVRNSSKKLNILFWNIFVWLRNSLLRLQPEILAFYLEQ